MYLIPLQDGILISDRNPSNASEVRRFEHAELLQAMRGWAPQQHERAFLYSDGQTLDRAFLIELIRLLRRVLIPSGRLFLSHQVSAQISQEDFYLAGLTKQTGDIQKVVSPSWIKSLDMNWRQAWSPRQRTIEPEGTPLVSIVMTAYKPDWFQAALQSALAQRWSNTEIIIGDDCPNDDIARIVKTHGSGDPRIRYQRNPPPGNARNNYLNSLNQARGDYIKFLNDDDLLHPDCIWRLVRCLEADPGCSIATSARRLIDSQGQPLMGRRGKQWLSWTDCTIEGSSLAAMQLEFRASFVGEPSTVLFRHADIAQHRPHFMSFAGRIAPALGDIHAWTSLLSAGDVAYLATPLSSFRQHPKQASLSGSNRFRFIDAWVDLRTLAASHGMGHHIHQMKVHRRPMQERPWWNDSYRAAWKEAQAQTNATGRVEAWKRVHQLDSHCIESQIALAKALIDSEQIVHAMSTLESVVRQFPGYLPAVALMAQCAHSVGQSKAGKQLFRTTTDGLGNWLQSRSNMVSNGITLQAPHHIWIPVPESACTAQLTLSHAQAHSSPLGIEIETSNQQRHRYLLKTDSKVNVTVHSPPGRTQLAIRISKLSPDQPTGLPDIRCGSFQLNLE